MATNHEVGVRILPGVPFFFTHFPNFLMISRNRCDLVYHLKYRSAHKSCTNRPAFLYSAHKKTASTKLRGGESGILLTRCRVVRSSLRASLAPAIGLLGHLCGRMASCFEVASRSPVRSRYVLRCSFRISWATILRSQPRSLNHLAKREATPVLPAHLPRWMR